MVPPKNYLSHDFLLSSYIFPFLSQFLGQWSQVSHSKQPMSYHGLLFLLEYLLYLLILQFKFLL